jgi:D-3-phosphoglycerate dehydrogenase
MRQSKYAVSGDVADLDNNPMAIMLRSHKLQVGEVMPTVRCIARCVATHPCVRLLCGR